MAARESVLSRAVNWANLLWIGVSFVALTGAAAVNGHVRVEKMDLTLQRHLAQPAHEGTAEKLSDLNARMARIEQKVDSQAEDSREVKALLRELLSQRR